MGNKIPNFSRHRRSSWRGRPCPQVLLVGAIPFLIAGSLSVILGYKARIGASLLLVFLVLATYYFHDFWTASDPQVKQEQMIQFLKNLGLMGAMLLIIANGTGPMSLVAPRKDQRVVTQDSCPHASGTARWEGPIFRPAGLARERRVGVRHESVRL